MTGANPEKVSQRAKKRGLPQMGTLGAGNHYAEIQVIDEIYDKQNASKMGLDFPGQVCIMIHSGSRGLGHQVATDAMTQMDKAMAEQRIPVPDRQLSCAPIHSKVRWLLMNAIHTHFAISINGFSPPFFPLVIASTVCRKAKTIWPLWHVPRISPG